MTSGQRSAAEERELALSALQSLDAGVGREEWVRISMAAKAAGVGYADWLAWCETGANFTGERDCRDTWKSIKAQGRTTAATLFGLAQQSGWIPPEDMPRPSYSRTAPRKGPVKKSHSQEGGESPSAKHIERRNALWNEAGPADPLHPYLVRKGIGAANLRQIAVSEAARVLEYMPNVKEVPLQGDCLLVPIADAQGALQTLELIDSTGLKCLAAHLPRRGAFWTADPTALDDRVAMIGIAEGVATTCTVEAAAGHPVVAAGSWGNMEAVALALANAYPQAEFVLYPDRGEKQEAKAADLARATLGRSIPMPERCPQGWDYNDLAEAEGPKAVRAWIRPRLFAPSVRVSFGAAVERGRIEIDEVLPGLPRGTLGLLVGQGAVGKTMLALQVAASVALGRSLMPGPHFLTPVGSEPRSVALLLGEDSYEQIHNRLVQIADTFRLSRDDIERLDANLRILALDSHDMRVVTIGQGKKPEPAPFLPVVDRICRSAHLIFLDPLVRLHDSDENDNTAASALMLELARIGKTRNCAIVNLHHVPKAATGAKGDWRSARGAAAYSTSSRWQVLIAPGDDGAGLGPSESVIHVALVKHNYCAPKRRFGLERSDGGVLIYSPTAQPIDQPGGAPSPFPQSPMPSPRSSFGGGRGWVDD